MTCSQMTQIVVASRKENKLSDCNTRDLGKGRVAGLKKGKREPFLAFARFLHFPLQDSSIILSWALYLEAESC